MAGLLSGLSSLGLGNLEQAEIYEAPQEEAEKDGKDGLLSKVQIQVEEKDLVYDRNFECPVCGGKIKSKVMKSGKAKLLGTDMDLRPKYEGIDAAKYDVVVCTQCGFSALGRYFIPMTPVQKKMILEKISKTVKLHPYTGEIYSYEEALERYKLALACSIVRQAKNSEKAYTCLKSAWVLRGWQESLSDSPEDEKNKKAIAQEEKEYLKNALDGFINARSSEGFPMCGMDEPTVDYLIAVLACQFGQYEVASKLVSSLLVSPVANSRIKEKARELKEELLQKMKK